jgi:hypothetical protein
MKKIEREELKEAEIAGGCCKDSRTGDCGGILVP